MNQIPPDRLSGKLKNAPYPQWSECQTFIQKCYYTTPETLDLGVLSDLSKEKKLSKLKLLIGSDFAIKSQCPSF